MDSGNIQNLDTPASYIFTPIWTLLMSIFSNILQNYVDSKLIPAGVLPDIIRYMQILINLHAAYSRNSICSLKQANFEDLSESGNAEDVKQYLTHYVKHDWKRNPKRDILGNIEEKDINMVVYQKLKRGEDIDVEIAGQKYKLNTFVCWNEKTGCHGNQDCNWVVGPGANACLASVGNSIEKSDEVGRKFITKGGQSVSVHKSKQMTKKNPLKGEGINPSCQRTNILGEGTAFSDFGCKCVNNHTNKDWINSPAYAGERNTWIQIEDPGFVIPGFITNIMGNKLKFE